MSVFMQWPVFFCSVLACVECVGQTIEVPSTVPGSALEPGLFALREMDLHLHSGLERGVPMDDWIDIAAKDGRKVMLVLDHIELYRKSAEEYEAWLKEKEFPRNYPMGAEGHKAFFADIDRRAADRKDLILFKGWEISETELDEGLEEEPMRMVDCIGWHISPNNGRKAPDGESLIKRAKQVKELQKRFPIPMILFHPFTMRVENLQRTAAKEGRDVKAITVDEYRFFKPGEQDELIAILKGSSIYIEMSKTSGEHWDDAAVREAMIADIKPLADAGVQFTVSTDNHYTRHTEKPFEPDRYCADCGITPVNANTIVRELLAIRAKRGLTPAQGPAKAASPLQSRSQ
jgi:hypothetical protein